MISTHLYMALGNHTDRLEVARPPYVLCSYLSIQPSHLEYARTPNCKGFMLDSGAFTFITSKRSQKIDFERYVLEYAEFVKKHDIELYYEVDVDDVFGVEPTRKLRTLLEDEVGRPCIPVWHRIRGKQAFLYLVQEYPYVGLGGVAANEISTAQTRHLRWFSREAHKVGSRVHGLGVSSPDSRRIVRHEFDSVDTTSWVSAMQYGSFIKSGKRPMFRHDRVETVVPDAHSGKLWRGGTVADRKLACLAEWSKYARYLDRISPPDLPRGGRALGPSRSEAPNR